MKQKQNENQIKDKKNLNNSNSLHEYELIKNNLKYKIIIEKKNQEIQIKCKNLYQIKLDTNNIQLYSKNLFNNLEEFYKSINNSFKTNKVILKEISINSKIKLEFNINIKNKLKNIEIILFYHKIEQAEIKNENIDSISFNPKNLKYNNALVKGSDISKIQLEANNDNIIAVFNSIDDILYVVYSRTASIILFNINDQKKQLEIKIYTRTNLIKYYFDKVNKRDLLAVSDGLDIKVWNINTLQCLSNIIIPKDLFGDLHKCFKCIQTLFFINNKNNIYINIAFPFIDLPMQVYDLEGNLIKKIKINLKQINHMGGFTDKNKSYFFACGDQFVKSFDFEKNDIYKNYIYDKNKNYTHAIINDSDKIKKLISSNLNGGIKIWNFHSGQLLNEIEVANNEIFNLCLWNNDYLFAACMNNPFVLVDLKNRKIIGKYGEKEDGAISLKKGINYKCGECLISLHNKTGKISLWLIKN